MKDLLIEGGLYFTVPLTGMAVLVIVLVFWTVLGIISNRASEPAHRRRLELLLHAGLFSFVFGLLSQALGLYQMLKAIERVGGVSPQLVAGGLAVSAIAPIFGLGILAVSLLAWIVFRRWACVGES